MRRLMRDIAEGKVIGDTTSLLDPEVLASIKEKYEDEDLKRTHKIPSW